MPAWKMAPLASGGAGCAGREDIGCCTIDAGAGRLMQPERPNRLIVISVASIMGAAGCAPRLTGQLAEKFAFIVWSDAKAVETSYRRKPVSRRWQVVCRGPHLLLGCAGFRVKPGMTKFMVVSARIRWLAHRILHDSFWPYKMTWPQDSNVSPLLPHFNMCHCHICLISTFGRGAAASDPRSALPCY